MASNIACEEEFIENYTDPTTADNELYTEGTSTMVSIVMPCILILGVVNNLFFLIIVFRVKRMRTVTNHYLVQLAVTDIVYLLFAAGERILRYAMSPIIYDKGAEGLVFGCIIIPFFRSVGYFASVFFITLVTLEMFLAICKPIKHMVLDNRRLTLKLTCGVWGVASFFACLLIPSFCNLELYCIIWPASEAYRHLPTVAASCQPVGKWAGEAHNIIQSAPFYIGLTVNITLYLCIMRSLTKKKVAAQERRPQIHARARNRVARMLAINCLVSFGLLAPFEIFSLVTAFMADYAIDYRTLSLILQILRSMGYLNSAINPLVFYAVHPRYRKAFIETSVWCLHKGPCVRKNAIQDENSLS